jgi:NAD dependent epimerase/dehydratase family enzyme
MKLAFREPGSLILKGQRVLPERLRKAGFSCDYPELEPALRNLLD